MSQLNSVPIHFDFVGDEHPNLRANSDVGSRGANYIISQNLLSMDTYLILEFFCHDKGHQETINQFLQPGSSLEAENSVRNILGQSNLLRGYKGCQNLSFLALLKESKKKKSKVICGDSRKALKENDRDLRHLSLNNEIFNMVQKIVKFSQSSFHFVVLCGDRHLFDLTKSPSIPKMVKDFFPNSTIRIFIQESPSFDDVRKIDQNVNETLGIKYNYLPSQMDTIIEPEEFKMGQELQIFKKISGSSDSILDIAKNSEPNSGNSFERFQKPGEDFFFEVEAQEKIKENENFWSSCCKNMLICCLRRKKL